MWENTDLGCMYRPHDLPYRPPARLIRAKKMFKKNATIIDWKDTVNSEPAILIRKWLSLFKIQRGIKLNRKNKEKNLSSVS